MPTVAGATFAKGTGRFDSSLNKQSNSMLASIKPSINV
jgi:hypothetical protein